MPEGLKCVSDLNCQERPDKPSHLLKEQIVTVTVRKEERTPDSWKNILLQTLGERPQNIEGTTSVL